VIRHRLPKYVQSFVDRHGKHRLYLRRPGFKKLPLPGPLWSPAFMQAYEAAMDGQRREPKGSSRTKPGTFDALIVEYYDSTKFTGLGESTRKAYRRVIERFRLEYGEAPVVDLQHKHIQLLIDNKAKSAPTAANDLLKKLKMLCRFAVKRDYRQDDPTIPVDRARTKKGGHRTWSEVDIEKFRETHTSGDERLALELLLNTGQRRSDVVRMGRQHVRGGMITVRQQKTGAQLEIPLHPDLVAALAAVPGDRMTFLVRRGGKPWHPDSFGHWFNKACKAAGLDVGLSPHGLRKSMCTRLAEAGCSALQIMAISGHRNIREVETYVEAANQKRLAKDAIGRLEVSNLSARLDNATPKPLKRKE